MSEKVQAPDGASPLEGIAPNTLDELMSRDPLDLADADIEKIVSVLREQRKRWIATESAPKAPKAATGKRTATAGDISDLMKDLGL